VTSPGDGPALHLDGVRFAYADGPFRLDVPDLRVAAGERVAVIGPSGSGKTTLLHLVAGIVTPDAGRVVTGGVEVSALSEVARRRFRLAGVGLVFQAFELVEYLSVLDNLLLPFHLDRTLPGRQAAEPRARALAERVGLGDKLERPPARLSQGERQRVAVCRALVMEPPLLLADEPTGNLDPHTGRIVLDELVEVAAERDATLLVVTHDHGLLERFDRVVDMDVMTSPSAGAEATS
jgi:ABC-type lipoprotein export system ATPase subunit